MRLPTLRIYVADLRFLAAQARLGDARDASTHYGTA